MLPPPAQTKPKTPIALRPLGRLGEQVHDQRQRHGRDDRAAEALHGARGDQQRLRVGQAAGERGEREQRDAEQEQPAVAVEVAEPAAEQQEAAEGQHVGVDHPDQRGLGEAEVGPDRRQRDVHDRRVEHDHQVAEAQHDQGQPALPLPSVVVVTREASLRYGTSDGRGIDHPGSFQFNFAQCPYAGTIGCPTGGPRHGGLRRDWRVRLLRHELEIGPVPPSRRAQRTGAAVRRSR